MARMIDYAAARSLVLGALRAAGEPGVPDEADVIAGDASVIRAVPGWVTRFGFVQAAAGSTWWLYVERSPGRTVSSFEPGQATLDLAAGRYVAETLDVDAGQWTALESAAGGPLVAGLSCPGRAAILRARRLPIVTTEARPS